MPDSVISACSSKPSTEIARARRNRLDPILPLQDDGGNQTDSSNSNSSLGSSPRYNERHPRVLRKKSSGRVYYGTGSSSGNLSHGGSGGSYVMLGSRTSLPPLDENNPLGATESQLAFNLRCATRSASWTNQKILDAIDGLSTKVQELDPCFALGVKPCPVGEVKEDANFPKITTRRRSIEKLIRSKSTSNSVSKSRSTGSVNPPTTPNQNRDNSLYNFLCGIREDEDEEQQLPSTMEIYPSNKQR